MNPHELRIGNYLAKSLKSGQGKKIKNKITFTDFQHIYLGDGSLNYDQIPLTEEILLNKCKFQELNDFEKNSIDHEYFSEILYILIDNVYIGKDNETGLYHFLYVVNGNGNRYFVSISAPMQHLHTLQNYYVTFKGQELEINL